MTSLPNKAFRKVAQQRSDTDTGKGGKFSRLYKN